MVPEGSSPTPDGAAPIPSAPGAATGARLEGVDALKGGAIVAVVTIHALALGTANLGRRSSAIAAALLSLAVPTFIGVSAFLAVREVHGDAPSDFADAIRRRIGRIVPVYAAWTILYVLFDYAVGGGPRAALSKQPLLEVILLGGAFYHLFFLPALAQSLLVLPFARRLGDRLPALVATIVIGGAALAAARSAGDARWAVELFDRHWFLVYLPVLGVAWALARRSVRVPAGAAVALGAAAAVALVVEALATIDAGASPSSAYARAGIPLGVLGLLALAVALPRIPPVAGWLALLGRRSLGVYLVHPAILYLVLRAVNLQRHRGIGVLVAVTLVVTVASLVFTLVVERTPIAWLVGGRRRGQGAGVGV